MTRRAAIAGGLLAVAAVLSSCSSPSAPGSDAVAAVDGTELSRTTLAGLVDASATPSTDPSGTASSVASDVRQVMTDWLRLAALGTDMSAVSTRDELDQQTAEASSALAEPFLADVSAAYAKGWDGSPKVCLAIIQIPEGGDAQQVLDALAGGMSFADAAAKFSADPQTASAGGVVTFQDGSHCAEPATLNPAVSEQMKGALPGDPVVLSLSGGQGVLVIRPFDELPTVDQISVDPTVQQKVANSFSEQIADADIFVDSRYGRWDESSASVLSLFNG
ncbi:MAG: peptidylprolyl isomerase [Ilumatobacteraceae bacterium]